MRVDFIFSAYVSTRVQNVNYIFLELHKADLLKIAT